MSFFTRSHLQRASMVSAGFAIAAIVVSATQPASAASTDERCRNYASKAVEQNAQNIEQKCRYTGKHWSDSRQSHVSWCLSVGGKAGVLKEQHQERDIALRKCRGGGGGGGSNDRTREAEGNKNSSNSGGDIDNRCRNYAQQAVKQSKAAIKNKCGFGGDRWSENGQYHAKWCKSVGGNVGTIKAQNRERAQMLKNCKTRK